MKYKLPLFLLFTFFSLFSFAQDDAAGSRLEDNLKSSKSVLPADFFKTSYKGTVGAQFNSLDNGEEILQQEMTLKLKVDVNGDFRIITYAMNGGDYKSNSGSIKNPELNVKHLYIKKKIGDNTYVDVGAMSTTYGDSMTGLSKDGWIDGARVTLLLDSGDKIEVTAGHLGDPSEANLFSRVDDFKFDYYEVKVSGRVLENLMYQAGIQSIDDEDYIRIAGKKTLEVLTGQLLRLTGEAMVNLETGGTKLAAGMQFQIGKLFSAQSNTIAFVNFLHTSDDFGVGQKYMNENFLSDEDGSKIQIGIKGRIGDNKNLSWNVSYGHSLESGNHEVRVGIEWKFGGPRLRR